MSEKNSSKLIPLIFIFPFLVGLSLVLFDYFQSSDSPKSQNQSLTILSQSETSNNFVTEDFKKLYKAQQLPDFFLKLKKITWLYREDDLKKLIPENSIPFTAVSSGLYNLEIEAFSASNEKTRIIVLQFNLFEIKSGNKVFELSRNYEIQEK